MSAEIPFECRLEIGWVSDREVADLLGPMVIVVIPLATVELIIKRAFWGGR